MNQKKRVAAALRTVMRATAPRCAPRSGEEVPVHDGSKLTSRKPHGFGAGAREISRESRYAIHASSMMPTPSVDQRTTIFHGTTRGAGCKRAGPPAERGVPSSACPTLTPFRRRLRSELAASAELLPYANTKGPLPLAWKTRSRAFHATWSLGVA